MNSIKNEKDALSMSKAVESKLDGRIRNASLNGKKRPLSAKSKEIIKKMESLATDLRDMNIPCFLMAFNENAYDNAAGHIKNPDDASFFYECYTSIEAGAFAEEAISPADVMIEGFLSVIMRAKDDSDYSVNLEEVKE